ncbi:hypothetical protein AUC71_09145 [Methyloceanibacter marginalis]|uniref:Uncharacterized protein n=1 Tax=Methyloceanibacter marginalis TaxID=1774971 RepID=A0A1E3WCH5_9HYPH|nr:hypothetical protein AUC71_09145 [Methyloceanibacter marginalis]
MFPDGAILVKDVFATNTEALTTGIASYADTLKGRFVMVKDKTDRHAANRRCGATDGAGRSTRVPKHRKL